MLKPAAPSRPLRVGLVAAIALAGTFLEAPVAHAQRPTGTVIGVVKDETGVPIPLVEIAASKYAQSVRSDSVGKFKISLPAGVLEMAFRRVGYSPFLAMIEIPDDDTTEIEVKLTTNPRTMSAVVVKEDSVTSHRLDLFERNRKMGVGHFITRQQILRRDPMQLSDMLRSIPGTVLIPSGASSRAVLRFSRAGPRCAPQYYVDGIMITDYNIDDMPVSDVEGIELYSGIAGLPPEYGKARGNRECGTVAIWTRIPGK